MNDEFSSRASENEESSTEIRRPLRRARRTVAPFSQLGKAEERVEAVTEPATEEIAEEAAPAVEEITEVAPAVEEMVAEPAPAAEEIEPEKTLSEPAVTEEAAPFIPEMAEKSEFSPAEEIENAPAEESAEESLDDKAREDAPEEIEITEEAEKPEEKEELSPAASTFDWVKSFLFSLTAVIFVFTLLFRGVTVNGGSMLPTLNNAEYLIISDLLYTPKTGDIVVVQSPHYKNGKEPLIKRIIATGGQKVKINFETWEVWVDGKLLEEDYVLRDNNTRMEPEDMSLDENGIAEFRVDQNCVFVMGDHRNDSLDSRSNSVGQIDERYIMGRVLLRITPLDKFGKVE